MDKATYVVDAIAHNKHLNRGWLLSTFGILPETMTYDEGIGLCRTGTKLEVAVPSDPTLMDEITDYQVNIPLFGRNEKLDLKAGDLSCLKENVTTTYGILIMNALLIEYPYRGLVNYINGQMTPAYLNKMAYDTLMRDDCTVEMHLRFENAVSAIMCLSQTVVPSATRKSITTNPEVARLKPKLLEEYANRMHDAAAVAELQNKIADLDTVYLKGDASEDFFIGGKSKISRLRVGGMYGAEADFYDESKISVMTNSLEEGWGIKDMQMLANATRGGSFNRGANTALGGQAVKEIARIFQNYNLVQNDCLTKTGLFLDVDSNNYKNIKGRYLVGTNTPIDEKETSQYVGKTIMIRSPAHCKSEGTSICSKCAGNTLSNSGVGINGMAIDATSNFLSLFLQLIHSSVLTTARYSYTDRMT